MIPMPQPNNPQAGMRQMNPNNPFNAMKESMGPGAMGPGGVKPNGQTSVRDLALAMAAAAAETPTQMPMPRNSAPLRPNEQFSQGTGAW